MWNERYLSWLWIFAIFLRIFSGKNQNLVSNNRVSKMSLPSCKLVYSPLRVALNLHLAERVTLVAICLIKFDESPHFRRRNRDKREESKSWCHLDRHPLSHIVFVEHGLADDFSIESNSKTKCCSLFAKEHERMKIQVHPQWINHEFY